jgi:hypothetical protein
LYKEFMVTGPWQLQLTPASNPYQIARFSLIFKKSENWIIRGLYIEKRTGVSKDTENKNAGK